VQVLGTPEPPTRIEVRWPGGKLTTTPLPKDATDISLDPQGVLTEMK
jgi:hypothetical protein